MVERIHSIVTPESIIIPQEYSGYCGPACWSHILGKMGINTTQVEIAKIGHCTQSKGISHRNMLKIGRTFGTECYAQTHSKLSRLQRLIDKGYYVIVNFMYGDDSKNNGHYSILESADPKTIITNNPEATGSIQIFRTKDFEEKFYDYVGGRKVKGWALIIKPKI